MSTISSSNGTWNINPANQVISTTNVLNHTHNIEISNSMELNWDNEIPINLMKKKNGNSNEYTNIFKINADGVLFIRGTYNSDQDIQLFASNNLEAITAKTFTNDLDNNPYAYDRVLVFGCNGDGTDQGGGCIFIGKNRLFYYLQGNDRFRTLCSFVPFMNSTLSTDELITYINEDILTSTIYAYPAAGKINLKFPQLNGSKIYFKRLTNMFTQNNPLKIYPGFASVYEQYNGYEQYCNTKNPTEYIASENDKFFKLVKYTRDELDNSTGYLHRYFFTGNSKTYAYKNNGFGVNYNYIKTDGNDNHTIVEGDDYFILENYAPCGLENSDNTTYNGEYRFVYIFTNIFCAKKTDDGYPGHINVTKNGQTIRFANANYITLGEYRTLTENDVGKFFYESSSKVNEITAINLTAKTISYITHTYARNKGNLPSVTTTTVTKTFNPSTKYRVYIFDAINNPHPIACATETVKYSYNAESGVSNFDNDTKWSHTTSAVEYCIAISESFSLDTQYKNNFIQNQYGLTNPSSFPNKFNLENLKWTIYKRSGSHPTHGAFKYSNTTWFNRNTHGFPVLKDNMKTYLDISETTLDLHYGFPISKSLTITDDETGDTSET